MDKTAISAVEMVRKKFPQAVTETVEFRGEQTIVLVPEQLAAVCAYLQKQQQYTFLSSVTAAGWVGRVPPSRLALPHLPFPPPARPTPNGARGPLAPQHPSRPP